jgi:hypothetical protein
MNKYIINLKNKNKISVDNIFNYYQRLINFNLDLYKTFNSDETTLTNNFINKNQIVYSLKTFYTIYPKFDYKLYSSSIKSNLGEVNTIIQWFNNGCNYDFLNNDNISKNKSILVYIHTNGFDESDGGTVVQYYLAKLLDEMGQQVRLFSKLKKTNSVFNNFYDNDLDLDNTIVIYCEGIRGNPLKAKYVVRWMLSELGKNVPLHYLRKWGKNELIYYFNSEIKISKNKDKIGTIYKYLTTLYVNPSIKNFNNDKSGYCFTLRKSHFHKKITNIHPTKSFEIPYKIKQNEIINVFNKYKYFISYDPLTFLTIIATLCGCVSIVYPIDKINKISWLQTTAMIEYFDSINKYELYGVAYGEEEIEYAKSTLHLVREQWDDIQEFCIFVHPSTYFSCLDIALNNS